MYIYIYVYGHVCVCMYIYIYICVYTHVYIFKGLTPVHLPLFEQMVQQDGASQTKVGDVHTRGTPFVLKRVWSHQLTKPV